MTCKRTGMVVLAAALLVPLGCHNTAQGIKADTKRALDKTSEKLHRASDKIDEKEDQREKKKDER